LSCSAMNSKLNTSTYCMKVIVNIFKVIY
jgi:hypothetical protein